MYSVFLAMPELPEVETVMRGMRSCLQGQTIRTVVVRRPDLRWPVPPELATVMAGRKIESFRRRGKYIFMRLSGGWSVVLHLGMSGRIATGHVEPGREIPKHEHIAFETEGGFFCGLTDPRRFGAVDLVRTDGEDQHRFVASMGCEPLGDAFNAAYLNQAFAGRRTPVKAALLDQRLIAGLGNIYVCEALYRARLHPEFPAGEIGDAKLGALADAVRAVLTEAVAAGGSSLRDYVQPDGELGYFQHAWRVYGREGERCPDCPAAAGEERCPGVVRIVQSGRSTFFCPRLQPYEG